MHRTLIAISIISLIWLSCNKPGQHGAPQAHTETQHPTNAPKEKSSDISDMFVHLVLAQKQVGIKYFLKIHSQKVLEYENIYLGTIQANNGDSIRFIMSTVFSGLYEDSKHASAQLRLYDKNDGVLGSYYIGGAETVVKVQDNNLLFSYKDWYDDCSEVTAVSFRDSIPKQIFVKCKGEYGNIWSLY